jgi:glycerophosphoryl diester phosphodiesterase
MALPPPPDVAIIAHRGASGHAPEHTFAAYDLAVAFGADYLEQDVQLSADGALVVIHDDTVDRTTGGTGAVKDLTLAQLQALGVLTLGEVLARYGHAQRYYIETKAPGQGIEEQLMAMLREHDLIDAGPAQVVIQSFSAGSLRRVGELEPRLPLIQLVGLGEPELLDDLAGIAAHAAGIGPNHRLLDRAAVEQAHAHGLLVHPYTLNTPTELDATIALGIDGAFTNFPDRMATALGR